MLYERDYGISLVEVEGEVNDTTGKPLSAKDLYREASIKFEWSLEFSDSAFLPDRGGTRMTRLVPWYFFPFIRFLNLIESTPEIITSLITHEPLPHHPLKLEEGLHGR